MTHTAKNIIYIIFLFALIIGAGMISTMYLGKTSDDLYLHLQKAEDYAHINKWKLAKEELYVMENKWQKIKKVWATLIDHAEIDNISSSLSRAIKLIEEKNLSMALVEISLLKSFIFHIPEKELPTLDNIF